MGFFKSENEKAAIKAIKNIKKSIAKKGNIGMDDVSQEDFNAIMYGRLERVNKIRVEQGLPPYKDLYEMTFKKSREELQESVNDLGIELSQEEKKEILKKQAEQNRARKRERVQR